MQEAAEIRAHMVTLAKEKALKKAQEYEQQQQQQQPPPKFEQDQQQLYKEAKEKFAQKQREKLQKAREALHSTNTTATTTPNKDGSQSRRASKYGMYAHKEGCNVHGYLELKKVGGEHVLGEVSCFQLFFFADCWQFSRSCRWWSLSAGRPKSLPSRAQTR